MVTETVRPEVAKVARAIGACLQDLASEAGANGLADLQSLIALAAALAHEQALSIAESLPQPIISGPTLVWSR